MPIYFKERIMKHKQMLYSSIVLIVLIVSAFVVGGASATVGCFTDTIGNPFETFICWMKDNGVTSGIGGGLYDPDAYVTRGQMAVFMNKSAQVPPETGQIQVVMPPTEWHRYPTSTHTFSQDQFFAWTKFRWTGGIAGVDFIMGQPTLPVALYGRKLSLSGFEYCYDATIDTAFIDEVKLYIYDQVAGAVDTPSYVLPVLDLTDRTDAACRNYTFTPVALTGEKIVFIQVIPNMNAASSFEVRLGRATFVLQPTATLATSLSKEQVGSSADQVPAAGGDFGLDSSQSESTHP